MLRRVGWVGTVLVLAGCVRLSAEPQWHADQGSTALVDLAPLLEAGADTTRPDGPLPFRDGAAPDSAAPDSTAPDSTTSDSATGDSAAPDSAAPDSVGAPCTSGITTFSYPNASMVICESPQQYPTQCLSDADCAPGWHLCTASEYLARGGASVPAPTRAWMASCIRDSGAVYAPTDTICSGCDSGGTILLSYPTSWACQSGVEDATSAKPYMGVHTSTSCLRVGINAPATEAYWGSSLAGIYLGYALCCLP